MSYNTAFEDMHATLTLTREDGGQYVLKDAVCWNVDINSCGTAEMKFVVPARTAAELIMFFKPPWYKRLLRRVARYWRRLIG